MHTVLENIKNTPPQVLLATEEGLSLLLAKAHTQTQRFKLFFTGSSQEIFNFATTQNPSLIVLDYELPNFDALNLCTQLKGQNISREIPVLLIAPPDFKKEDQIKAYELGVEDILFKPVIPEVFDLKIGPWVKRIETTRTQSISSKKHRYDGKLDQLLASAPAAICCLRRVDVDLTFEFANPAYQKLVGRTDLVGRKLYDVFPELKIEEPELCAIIEDVAIEGKSFRARELPIRLDWDESGKPTERFLDFSYEPVYNENGQPEGLTTFAFDITDQVVFRKQVEQSKFIIENERENFRNLFRQTPEMVCILRGPEHTFEFVNEAHIKVLGFDATGQTVREAQPESIEVHGLLDQVYRTGKTAELREIPVTVSQRLRHFNLTYSARRNPEGKIDGVMILGAEVTAEIEIREKLKRAQYAYERSVDGSPAILWITEKDGSCTYLSRQWYEFTGQTPAEALGFGWLDATHPEDKQKTAETYFEANAAQKPFYAEYRLRTKSGDYRWAIDAGNPRYDSDGNYIGYAGTVFDIHERKLAEENLAESESRYRTLFESVDQGFCAIDILFDQNQKPIDYRFVEVNSTFEKQTGLKGASGKTALELVPDLDEFWIKTYANVATTGESIRFEQDAPEMNRVFDVYAFRAGPPRQFRVGLLFSDITQRKKTEAELRSAKEDAERANRLKSAFLANMSHEIRTPLGAMLGFADLLRDQEITPTEYSNYLDILSKNGEQLSVIINDILDLSKVEAGHLTLEFTETSADQIAAEVISLLEVKANEKNLTLDYVSHESTPKSLVSDPTRVRQVLLNLVSNAIKFTRSGFVQVKSYGCKKANGKDTICFEVVDTGIGLESDQVDRIFEVFVQADGSMTRRFGGTGLGLALSRRLARALGGDVSVIRSEPQNGSTFLFQVEHQPEKLQREIASAPEEPEYDVDIQPDSLRGLKILVVDDAQDNQHLISRYLTKHGAEVESAENGFLGYRKALAQNFDLVLMDIQMPEMDGYTATQKLRAAGFKKPIIALTAHAMNEVRKKCLNMGCTDHLTKPINPHRLVQAIVKYTL